MSHDDGRTWQGPSGPGSLYELKTPAYKLSPIGDGWHLMAPGITLSTGEWLLPMNISTDPLPLSEIRSELVFGFSKNVFTVKDPADVAFDFFPSPPYGVHVEREATPGESLGQEPQVVELSDGRLFCACRTGNGCLYYTVSSDHGRTWAKGQPLLYKEGGARMLHPNAACPLEAERHVCTAFCNNDGTFNGGADPHITSKPLAQYVSIGRKLARAKASRSSSASRSCSATSTASSRRSAGATSHTDALWSAAAFFHSITQCGDSFR